MTDRIIEVPSEHDGERADKTVATLLGVSRRVARSMVEAGGVTMAGSPVQASDRLRTGDVLATTELPLASALVADDSVEFGVAYEDASLVIVDKPIGVVVHPSPGQTGGTLVHGLLGRFPEIEGVGNEDRWGIVHRLDRDTSGLLVVARTSDVHHRLTEMMRSRSIHRRYLALVRGVFTNTIGTVDAPIGRDPLHRTRMSILKDGRPAVTHYRRIATWAQRETSLLSVTLETGRTHQIRVHMQAIEHPIIGDPVYGRAGVAGDPGRPWLHARQLTFDHPVTGEPLDVVSPLPADLIGSLATLGVPDEGSMVDIDGAEL